MVPFPKTPSPWSVAGTFPLPSMNDFSSTWLRERASGVLAHVSSLPGEFGIGNLGPSARLFVDFLADAGFHYWQICPLGPTGYGDSPYQSFSSFAGNPYFIDLQALVDAGLLTQEEVEPLRRLPAARVDYGELYRQFWHILGQANRRFEARGRAIEGWESYALFCDTHAGWLRPFAEFMALKGCFGGRAWTEWPAVVRSWQAGLRAGLPREAAEVADLHSFAQYVFFLQWQKLRRYAHARGVRIIGDVPIFVALDSADTWHHREVFRLDSEGRPPVAAGVPPDYFSEFGQFWGNPLYDWEHLASQGYGWWVDRLRAAFELYDVVRLDHFRGFDTFWEVPADSADARSGRWVKGPGLHFFDALGRALPQARIIAEDLGYVTEDVVALRRAAGLPGMKILQFGYGHDDNNVNLPHFFPRECVVYTGTHDNDTARGWLESLSPDAFHQVDRYFGLGSTVSAWPLVRAALASVARLAVIPMQDLLDLPGSARMNRPGTAEGNWQWRFTAEQLSSLAAQKTTALRGLHALYDRTPDSKQRDYSAPPAALSGLHG